MVSKKVLESVPSAIRMLRKLTVEMLDGSLTFHQTRILFYIKEGFGQSQIADALQVSAAAVCKVTHQLTEKGFITMNPGEDRRERLMELTKNGSKILTAVSKQVEKRLNKSIDTLTSQERDDLIRGLTVLDKLIGQIKEG